MRFNSGWLWLRLVMLTVSLAALSMVSGCGKDGAPAQPADYAVANSYLGCVVKDLCGAETAVMELVPPGMCPGHYDIAPEQVQRLCRAKVLLLFSFQQGLADGLGRVQEQGLQIKTVTPPAGLCVPGSYVAVAESVGKILKQIEPQNSQRYDEALAAIRQRMGELSRAAAALVDEGGLRDRLVVCSMHQSVFARWLGLKVDCEYNSAQEDMPAYLNGIMQAAKENRPQCVIGNIHEGTQLAESLGSHLSLPVAMWRNFPAAIEPQDGQPAFDRMARENIRLAREAMRP